MRELPSFAVAELDGFSVVLLKRCCAALTPPLANIWRQSLFDGTLLSICKLVYIIPVHKGKGYLLLQKLPSQLVYFYIPFGGSF